MKNWLDGLVKNKWLGVWLIGIFLVFTSLHFWRLADQEFTGDEASPMLNIDVALDSLSTGNINYLAYPFLWFHEPLRAVMEGALLHFLGVRPVLLRLPNVVFDLLTFWALVIIFVRERVDKRLIAGSMAAYSVGAFLMIGRLALTDGWTRLMLVVIGYWCYEAWEEGSVKKLMWAIIIYAVSMLRVLDTGVMIVPIVLVVWKIKAWRDKKFVRVTTVAGGVLAVYFGLWFLLPYSAYKKGLLESYNTNGLFYYLGRAGDGSARDLSFNFQILTHYSSVGFALWLLSSFVVCAVVAKLRKILLVSLPALLAVYLLFSPSIHVTSYIGIFFWQAVMVADYVMKKFAWSRTAVLVAVVLIVVLNLQQMYLSFWKGRIANNTRFVWGHADVPRPGFDVDLAVKRIYERHGIDPTGRIEVRRLRWEGKSF